MVLGQYPTQATVIQTESFAHFFSVFVCCAAQLYSRLGAERNQRLKGDKISGCLYVPMWQKNVVAVCIS